MHSDVMHAVTRGKKRMQKLTEVERNWLDHIRFQYGEIVDINLVRDKETGKSKVRLETTTSRSEHFAAEASMLGMRRRTVAD